MVYEKQILLLTVPKADNPKIKVSVDPVSSEDFLVHIPVILTVSPHNGASLGSPL